MLWFESQPLFKTFVETGYQEFCPASGYGRKNVKVNADSCLHVHEKTS